MAVVVQTRSDSRRARQDLKLLKESVGRIEKTASATATGLRNVGVAAATLYTLYQSTSAITKVTDSYRRLESRIAISVDTIKEQTYAFKKLNEVAIETRNNQETIVDLYSRISRATQTLGVSQKDVIQVTKSISKAITLSGSTAESANAAIIQLGQGLAAGALRGQELNSVMEQTPAVALAIARGLGITIGQLRAFANEGKLTASSIVTSLLNQRLAIEEEFKKISTTQAQAIEVFSTGLGRVVNEIDRKIGFSTYLVNSFVRKGKVLNQLGILFKDENDRTDGGNALDDLKDNEQERIDLYLSLIAGRKQEQQLDQVDGQQQEYKPSPIAIFIQTAIAGLRLLAEPLKLLVAQFLFLLKIIYERIPVSVKTFVYSLIVNVRRAILYVVNLGLPFVRLALVITKASVAVAEFNARFRLGGLTRTKRQIDLGIFAGKKDAFTAGVAVYLSSLRQINLISYAISTSLVRLTGQFIRFDIYAGKILSSFSSYLFKDFAIDTGDIYNKIIEVLLSPLTSAFRELADLVTTAFTDRLNEETIDPSKLPILLALKGLYVGLSKFLSPAIAFLKRLFVDMVSLTKMAVDKITTIFTSLYTSVVGVFRGIYERIVGNSIWVDTVNEIIANTERLQRVVLQILAVLGALLIAKFLGIRSTIVAVIALSIQKIITAQDIYISAGKEQEEIASRTVYFLKRLSKELLGILAVLYAPLVGGAFFGLRAIGQLASEGVIDIDALTASVDRFIAKMRETTRGYNLAEATNALINFGPVTESLDELGKGLIVVREILRPLGTLLNDTFGDTAALGLLAVLGTLQFGLGSVITFIAIVLKDEIVVLLDEILGAFGTSLDGVLATLGLLAGKFGAAVASSIPGFLLILSDFGSGFIEGILELVPLGIGTILKTIYTTLDTILFGSLTTFLGGPVGGLLFLLLLGPVGSVKAGLALLVGTVNTFRSLVFGTLLTVEKSKKEGGALKRFLFGTELSKSKGGGTTLGILARLRRAIVSFFQSVYIYSNLLGLGLFVGLKKSIIDLYRTILAGNVITNIRAFGLLIKTQFLSIIATVTASTNASTLVRSGGVFSRLLYGPLGIAVVALALVLFTGNTNAASDSVDTLKTSISGAALIAGSLVVILLSLNKALTLIGLTGLAARLGSIGFLLAGSIGLITYATIELAASVESTTGTLAVLAAGLYAVYIAFSVRAATGVAIFAGVWAKLAFILTLARNPFIFIIGLTTYFVASTEDAVDRILEITGALLALSVVTFYALRGNIAGLGLQFLTLLAAARNYLALLAIVAGALTTVVLGITSDNQMDETGSRDIIDGLLYSLPALIGGLAAVILSSFRLANILTAIGVLVNVILSRYILLLGVSAALFLVTGGGFGALISLLFLSVSLTLAFARGLTALQAIIKTTWLLIRLIAFPPIFFLGVAGLLSIYYFGEGDSFREKAREANKELSDILGLGTIGFSPKEFAKERYKQFKFEKNSEELRDFKIPQSQVQALLGLPGDDNAVAKISDTVNSLSALDQETIDKLREQTKELLNLTETSARTAYQKQELDKEIIAANRELLGIYDDVNRAFREKGRDFLQDTDDTRSNLLKPELSAFEKFFVFLQENLVAILITFAATTLFALISPLGVIVGIVLRIASIFGRFGAKGGLKAIARLRRAQKKSRGERGPGVENPNIVGRFRDRLVSRIQAAAARQRVRDENARRLRSEGFSAREAELERARQAAADLGVAAQQRAAAAVNTISGRLSATTKSVLKYFATLASIGGVTTIFTRDANPSDGFRSNAEREESTTNRIQSARFSTIESTKILNAVKLLEDLSKEVGTDIPGIYERQIGGFVAALEQARSDFAGADRFLLPDDETTKERARNEFEAAGIGLREVIEKAIRNVRFSELTSNFKKYLAGGGINLASLEIDALGLNKFEASKQVVEYQKLEQAYETALGLQKTITARQLLLAQKLIPLTTGNALRRVEGSGNVIGGQLDEASQAALLDNIALYKRFVENAKSYERITQKIQQTNDPDRLVSLLKELSQLRLANNAIANYVKDLSASARIAIPVIETLYQRIARLNNLFGTNFTPELYSVLTQDERRALDTNYDDFTANRVIGNGARSGANAALTDNFAIQAQVETLQSTVSARASNFSLDSINETSGTDFNAYTFDALDDIGKSIIQGNAFKIDKLDKQIKNVLLALSGQEEIISALPESISPISEGPQNTLLEQAQKLRENLNELVTQSQSVFSDLVDSKAGNQAVLGEFQAASIDLTYEELINFTNEQDAFFRDNLKELGLFNKLLADSTDANDSLDIQKAITAIKEGLEKALIDVREGAVDSALTFYERLANINESLGVNIDGLDFLTLSEPDKLSIGNASLRKSLFDLEKDSGTLNEIGLQDKLEDQLKNRTKVEILLNRQLIARQNIVEKINALSDIGIKLSAGEYTGINPAGGILLGSLTDYANTLEEIIENGKNLNFSDDKILAAKVALEQLNEETKQYSKFLQQQVRAYSVSLDKISNTGISKKIFIDLADGVQKVILNASNNLELLGAQIDKNRDAAIETVRQIQAIETAIGNLKRSTALENLTKLEIIKGGTEAGFSGSVLQQERLSPTQQKIVTELTKTSKYLEEGLTRSLQGTNQNAQVDFQRQIETGKILGSILDGQNNRSLLSERDRGATYSDAGIEINTDELKRQTDNTRLYLNKIQDDILALVELINSGVLKGDDLTAAQAQLDRYRGIIDDVNDSVAQITDILETFGESLKDLSEDVFKTLITGLGRYLTGESANLVEGLTDAAGAFLGNLASTLAGYATQGFADTAKDFLFAQDDASTADKDESGLLAGLFPEFSASLYGATSEDILVGAFAKGTTASEANTTALTVLTDYLTAYKTKNGIGAITSGADLGVINGLNLVDEDGNPTSIRFPTINSEFAQVDAEVVKLATPELDVILDNQAVVIPDPIVLPPTDPAAVAAADPAAAAAVAVAALDTSVVETTSILDRLAGAFQTAYNYFTKVLPSQGNPSFSVNQPIPTLATGGMISGPGTGTSDSILARLSDGEFVVNASATKNNRGVLEAINSGNMPMFAEGGEVNGAQYTQGGIDGLIQNYDPMDVTSIANIFEPSWINANESSDVLFNTKRASFLKKLSGDALALFTTLVSETTSIVPGLMAFITTGRPRYEHISRELFSRDLELTPEVLPEKMGVSLHELGHAVSHGEHSFIDFAKLIIFSRIEAEAIASANALELGKRNNWVGLKGFKQALSSGLATYLLEYDTLSPDALSSVQSILSQDNQVEEEGLFDYMAGLRGSLMTGGVTAQENMQYIEDLGKSRDYYLGMAQGGYVSGMGTGTSDSIPAMLSNGEFVVNAKASKENYNLLKAINSGTGGGIDGLIQNYDPMDVTSVANVFEPSWINENESLDGLFDTKRQSFLRKLGSDALGLFTSLVSETQSIVPGLRAIITTSVPRYRHLDRQLFVNDLELDPEVLPEKMATSLHELGHAVTHGEDISSGVDFASHFEQNRLVVEAEASDTALEFGKRNNWAGLRGFKQTLAAALTTYLPSKYIHGALSAVGYDQLDKAERPYTTAVLKALTGYDQLSPNTLASVQSILSQDNQVEREGLFDYTLDVVDGVDSYLFGLLIGDNETLNKKRDYYLGMAQGGSVSGMGTGTSDSIPAMLSNGEFVVNAKASKENYNLLEAINRGASTVGIDGLIKNYDPMDVTSVANVFEPSWIKENERSDFLFDTKREYFLRKLSSDALGSFNSLVSETSSILPGLTASTTAGGPYYDYADKEVFVPDLELVPELVPEKMALSLHELGHAIQHGENISSGLGLSSHFQQDKLGREAEASANALELGKRNSWSGLRGFKQRLSSALTTYLHADSRELSPEVLTPVQSILDDQLPREGLFDDTVNSKGYSPQATNRYEEGLDKTRNDYLGRPVGIDGLIQNYDPMDVTSIANVFEPAWIKANQSSDILFGTKRKSFLRKLSSDALVLFTSLVSQVSASQTVLNKYSAGKSITASVHPTASYSWADRKIRYPGFTYIPELLPKNMAYALHELGHAVQHEDYMATDFGRPVSQSPLLNSNVRIKAEEEAEASAIALEFGKRNNWAGLRGFKQALSAALTTYLYADTPNLTPDELASVQSILDGELPKEGLFDSLFQKGFSPLIDKIYEHALDKTRDDYLGRPDEPSRRTSFFAQGGSVSGPGTGTSDSILARLSSGEFVVNAKDTKKNYNLLKAINSGMNIEIPGFQGGGVVGGSTGKSGSGGSDTLQTDPGVASATTNKVIVAATVATNEVSNAGTAATVSAINRWGLSYTPETGDNVSLGEVGIQKAIESISGYAAKTGGKVIGAASGYLGGQAKDILGSLTGGPSYSDARDARANQVIADESAALLTKTQGDKVFVTNFADFCTCMGQPLSELTMDPLDVTNTVPSISNLGLNVNKNVPSLDEPGGLDNLLSGEGKALSIPDSTLPPMGSYVKVTNFQELSGLLAGLMGQATPAGGVATPKDSSGLASSAGAGDIFGAPLIEETVATTTAVDTSILAATAGTDNVAGTVTFGLNKLGGALSAFQSGGGGLGGALAVAQLAIGAFSAFGGAPAAAATGGLIRGSGTGTSDSIAAMLSNGEYVINAASTRKNMALLDAINKGTVTGYAQGGLVGDSSDASFEKIDAARKENNNYKNTEVINQTLQITGNVDDATRRAVRNMAPELIGIVTRGFKERGLIAAGR